MSSLVTLIHLIKEFFLIGLLSFGGGYATLPFLFNLTQHYNWFTSQELSQMIAVATITPGPVGINVATYAGMKVHGVLTAFIATFSEVLPALIICLIISKLLKKFSDNEYVKSAIWALKPTCCALLSVVAIQLFINNIINNPNIILGGILFTALLLISILKNKDPLWFISISACVGIALIKFI